VADDLDGLPDPVIVAGDVDRQDIDLAAESSLLEQDVDVLGGDHRLGQP